MRTARSHRATSVHDAATPVTATPSAPQALKPSSPQALKPSTPQTLADEWVSALRSLGADASRLIRVKQVHGCSVHRVARGSTLPASGAGRPEADAIVSNQAGCALAVTVADCVPILIADARTGAAAAVHAGWRGTAAGVAAGAVRAMVDDFGVDPADLTAALGPSIGPDDYEVAESVVEAFLAAGHSTSDVDRWFRGHGRTRRLDLWSANRDQLVAAGVRPPHIFTCGLSTHAHPEFFESYRRDGTAAGRMAGLIVVPARI
jgi:YfiH family protein